MLIARYTTNASGVVPTFNSGYQYTVNETESNGIYTVEISSDTDFTSCSFYDKPELLTVEYLKVTSNVTDMATMFFGCSQLTQLDVSKWNTSNVTRMNHMFRSCSQLTQLDVSNWNTSNVTDMVNMFYNCLSLITLDLSNFNTSNVTDMSNMFYNCASLTTLDVSNFDTSNVTNMYAMFHQCSKLTSLDVSNFDTSNVATMYAMFASCSKLTLLDVSNFDTSKVTDMSSMFYNCPLLTQLDVSNFDTSKVTDMSYAFYNCPLLTQLDVSKWNTSNVTKMNNMFHNCSQLTQLDVSNWDTIRVSDMRYIFSHCSSLIKLDLGGWSIGSAMLEGFVRYCSSLVQLDLSNWDTSKARYVNILFSNCPNLRKIKLFNSNIPQLVELLPTRTVGNPGYLFTYKEIPNEKNWVSYICEDFNTKFELPQPLRRVGDVSDRLYWDYNKGHYCIEKNINEDYTILDTPIIIDLSIKNRISMVYDTKTRFNTNTIKTQVELSSPIYKIKPLGLSPNVTYTLRFDCLNAEMVTIDLGGHIIKVSPIENRVDIQIQTLETLTNEYISIYGNDGTVTNVMLFEGTDIGEVGYIDNITSVGKLQKDGSYKINLMTSPLIFRKGNK